MQVILLMGEIMQVMGKIMQVIILMGEIMQVIILTGEIMQVILCQFLGMLLKEHYFHQMCVDLFINFIIQSFPVLLSNSI